MTILKQLIDSLESDINLDQVREICDKISDEEISDIDKYIGPKGSNIFLSLCSTETKQEYTFLTLEREIDGSYILGLWKANKQKKKEDGEIKRGPLSRRITTPIKDDSPEKIIEEYAKMLKYLKGE